MANFDGNPSCAFHAERITAYGAANANFKADMLMSGLVSIPKHQKLVLMDLAYLHALSILDGRGNSGSMQQEALRTQSLNTLRSQGISLSVPPTRGCWVSVCQFHQHGGVGGTDNNNGIEGRWGGLKKFDYGNSGSTAGHFYGLLNFA
jgi:hypothetical protein